MKQENLDRLIHDLGENYRDATSLTECSRTLVKVPKVHFPKGCAPSHTAALVVIENSAPTPQLYLKQLPTLPSGKAPRSTSAVQFAGEAWYAFSFNQTWDENLHDAVQFVEGRLRRFALSE